jgi:diguanylate cyclase (GGDEF)-like protein
MGSETIPLVVSGSEAPVDRQSASRASGPRHNAKLKADRGVSAPLFARSQLALAAAASLAPLLALVIELTVQTSSPLALGAMVALALGGTAVPLLTLWRRALQVDALAETLSATTIPPGRGASLSRIAAAFAALERRAAALESRGDPARRDDPMTGLPNRQTAMRRARDEITRVRRRQEPLAAALVSLDIGPPAEDPLLCGRQDRALRLMAELLMQGLRAYDLVARWSHDQFVLLLPDAEVEHAVRAIERVRETARDGWAVRGGEPLPDIHAGVAVLQPDDATLAEIVARAEKVLTRARGGIGGAVQAAPGPRSHPAHLTPV